MICTHGLYLIPMYVSMTYTQKKAANLLNFTNSAVLCHQTHNESQRITGFPKAPLRSPGLKAHYCFKCQRLVLFILMAIKVKLSTTHPIERHGKIVK